MTRRTLMALSALPWLRRPAVVIAPKAIVRQWTLPDYRIVQYLDGTLDTLPLNNA